MEFSPAKEFIETIVQWESSTDRDTLADALTACLRRLNPVQRFYLLKAVMQTCVFQEGTPWGMLAERSFVSLLFLSGIEPGEDAWRSAPEFIQCSHSFFIHVGKCVRCQRTLLNVRG